MSAHRCSFCNAFSSRVDVARICDRCAEGRAGDSWCDFCKKTTNTDNAFICPKCAKGKNDDTKCDFCNAYGRAHVAQICRRCP